MAKHILLVDDNEFVGEALKEFLESEGYEVAYTSDGAEALRMAEDRRGVGVPFDIGISDVCMPGMDGVTLSRKLYSCCDLRMLLISGYPLEATAMEAMSAGVQGLFYKPIALNQLTDKLQEVLAM